MRVALLSLVLAFATVTASSTQTAFAAGPSVGIGSASMLEGNAGSRTLRFTVSMSQSSALAVSMHYATLSGTATSGVDFVAASGTLTIPATKTTGVINVTINGDSTTEANETFSVKLTAPVNATISRATGTGTILNDDPPAAAVQVGVGSAAVVEGNAGTRSLAFPVSLSKPSSGAVAVHFATAPGSALAGSDYTTTSGTALVSAGQTTTFVTVSVKSDVSFEADETFSVALSSPNGATIAAAAAKGTGTILNDDSAPSTASSWGYNPIGALGDPAVGTLKVLAPRQLGTATTWQSVATSETGSPYGLAVRTDGTLWAWGYNGYGNLGDGTTTDRTSPVQIGTDTNWSSVATGEYDTFALKTDGTLWAWGYNQYGELGDGNAPTSQSSPEQIGIDTNWATVAAGDLHTLAVKTDGTLWAWGYNNNGELGDANAPNNQASPEQIGIDTHWATVAAGSAHSVAVKDDGTLWAWGYNQYGELGDGTTTEQDAPEQIGVDADWANASAGNSHTAAVKIGGTLWAWGYNGNGQLGDGTNTGTTAPEQIGAGTNWDTVSAGQSDTIAVKTDSTLWAWGYNGYGQLGDGTTTGTTAPEQIGTDTNWASVAGGTNHSMAVKEDGTLWAWGDNSASNLGFPILHASPGVVGTAGPWKSISAGSNGFGVGVKANGTLWAWGYNGYGQLGDGTQIDRYTPVQVGVATNWATVSAGTYHVLAVRTNGTLWAWGWDGYGALGDNAAASYQLTPKQIGTDTHWKSVSAGPHHSLAIKTDGSLWAWGDNSYGELGDVTNTPRYVPTRIASPSTNWKSVTAGADDSLGIKTDGSLWAWGYNGYGQLGDNTTNSVFAPKHIGTATNWKTVAPGAGTYCTLAVRTDGSLWAWGYNGYGQFGNGSFTQQLVPTHIGTGTNWDTVAVGPDYTLALKGDHSLWAWGNNTSGQLGDGSVTLQSVPEHIGTGVDWDLISAGDVESLALRN